MKNQELCPAHAVWYGDDPRTCPKCDAAKVGERAQIAAWRAERAELYAMSLLTQKQWKRLHELDLKLGY